jgi:hypothetical protein
MAPDPRIAVLIEKALDAGIPQEALVGVLTAHGWPEREVYEALAQHYERVTGVAIPHRTGGGASAKEAFFYLLIFATLATWTIGFGYLAFALIDRWLADPLFTGYRQAWDTYTITSCLASLIVAFPLYLLISRAVIREAVADPGKLDSPVRKWLTYMALVVAAGFFMGDLITALTYLLRGELTSRFLAKSLVVLALSGGVFFYYFGGLRKTDASPVRANRDRIMAAVSSALVALIVILGFLQLGAPQTQRDTRADSQRVRELFQLTIQIENHWTARNSQLPPSLNAFPGRARADPVSHVPYQYLPGQGSQYQLCATFALSSNTGQPTPAPDAWVHPAGHHCFSLDAAMQAQPPIQLPAD